MKKILVLIAFVFAINTTAQIAYEKGMSKAFELWNANKTKEAVQLFERITNVEKDNWLPPFYVATIEILTSFSVKDEAELAAKLNKAQIFLDKASIISENNPEILITQALLHIAYITFDGQKYGMTLSAKNTSLYKKALKLAPKNPRVVLSKAEWDIGSARFFGQPITPYCEDVKRAIALAKKEKIKEKFYPKFFMQRAEKVLSKCLKPGK